MSPTSLFQAEELAELEQHRQDLRSLIGSSQDMIARCEDMLQRVDAILERIEHHRANVEEPVEIKKTGSDFLADWLNRKAS